MRFFFSPVAAVFFPASFFSAGAFAAGAFEAAGFFSAAAFGGILKLVWGFEDGKGVSEGMWKWLKLART